MGFLDNRAMKRLQRDLQARGELAMNEVVLDYEVADPSLHMFTHPLKTQIGDHSNRPIPLAVTERGLLVILGVPPQYPLVHRHDWPSVIHFETTPREGPFKPELRFFIIDPVEPHPTSVKILKFETRHVRPEFVHSVHRVMTTLTERSDLRGAQSQAFQDLRLRCEAVEAARDEALSAGELKNPRGWRLSAEDATARAHLATGELFVGSVGWADTQDGPAMVIRTETEYIAFLLKSMSAPDPETLTAHCESDLVSTVDFTAVEPTIWLMRLELQRAGWL